METEYKRTRLYGIWYGMRQRCYNEKNVNYHNYGKRGIKICDEWKNNFFAFSEWAFNNGYQDPPIDGSLPRFLHLTIDRIDGNKGYSPDNCQWITHSANSSKGHKDFQNRVAVREFISWLDTKCEEIVETKFPKQCYFRSGRRIRDFISFCINRKFAIGKLTCIEEKDLPKARAFAEKVFALFD